MGILTNPTAGVLPLDQAPMVPGQVIRDATFGTELRRVTGITGQPIGPAMGLWGRDARHHYSKDQAWNHDETMLWIEQRSASPGKMLLDANTFAPIVTSSQASATAKMLAASYEVRWLPGEPRQMVSWMSKESALVVWDVVTGERLRTIPVPTPVGAPKFGWLSEGTISDDGQWTALATSWPSPKTTGARDVVVLVNLKTGDVGAPCDVSGFTTKYANTSGGVLGNINISTRGNFVYCKLEGTPEYGFILRADHATLGLAPRPMSALGLRSDETKADALGWVACMSHADMNEMGGREVVVGGLRNANTSNGCSDAEKDRLGGYVAIDCATGAHVHVSRGSLELAGLKEAGDQHGSGRCYRRRTEGRGNWHLFTYACAAETHGQYTDELVLVNLDTRECERFGVTRTNDTADYRAEAHGCPSPTGAAVIFASSWSGAGAMPQAEAGERKAFVYSKGAAVPVPAPVARYALRNGQSDGVIEDTKTGRFVILRDLLPWLEANPPQ